jgi:hypothetical protein
VKSPFLKMFGGSFFDNEAGFGEYAETAGSGEFSPV